MPKRSSTAARRPKVIGPDELVLGSVNGVLEAINIHNTLRFNVYPLVGPKKVVCSFPASMKSDVIAAIDRYVSVSGTLRYKHWSDFPHAMEAQSIDVFKEDRELPTLADLRGIAPEATGDLMSEDFIEAIRDADW